MTSIETAEDHDTVSATTVVDASAAEVFDYLRRPANHAEISGDETVKGVTAGNERLELGSKFGMKMKIGLPYRISSKVVELEEDRVIAWAHFGRHRWRWTLEPLSADSTRVTETYDQSTAPFAAGLRLAGYPGRHRDNVEQSVRNVAGHFAGG